LKKKRNELHAYFSSSASVLSHPFCVGRLGFPSAPFAAALVLITITTLVSLSLARSFRPSLREAQPFWRRGSPFSHHHAASADFLLLSIHLRLEFIKGGAALALNECAAQLKAMNEGGCALNETLGRRERGRKTFPGRFSAS